MIYVVTVTNGRPDPAGDAKLPDVIEGPIRALSAEDCRVKQGSGPYT